MRSRETLCWVLSMHESIFYVYILQSASRRALYIGITNHLRHRVFQHKTHQLKGFTDDYNAIRLVHWEKFGSVGKTIAREKQLKRWRRKKKMWLVETMNAKWRDLAADWYPQLNPASMACRHRSNELLQHKVPRLRGASTNPTRRFARDDSFVVSRS